MRKPNVDALDAHIYGGLVLIAAGAGWIFPPAGVITLGAGLLGIAAAARWGR